MTDQTRNLLISLASHMAYMQGQLEARHELDDPEDYYWYRESVALRQKVTDALADGPAVPEGREPASVDGDPSDEELLEAFDGEFAEFFDSSDGFGTTAIPRSEWIKVARAALARWGTPNLTETRRSLKDAWAAHQPAIEAAAKAGMEACRMDEPAVPDGREPASVTGEPSDEELLELMPQQMRDDLAAAARALAGFDPDNIKAASVFRIILNRHVADHARTVLARWGNHPGSPDSSPQPVAVGERLPQPEDCDELGACWWYAEVYGWEMRHREHPRSNRWSHWLPAHALPLPQGEGEL